MTEPSHAVFLSYASQDLEAAQRICEALRAARIEVFFDQSELRGGDMWDQKIRREIHECALFVPIISQHTQERLEGYFRREWKVAIDRTHDIAEQKPFLVPVVIDGTRDTEAFVPDTFRAVQWTRLPGGETPAAFVERIRRLLAPELSPMSAVSSAASGIREPLPASRRSKRVLLAIGAVIVLTVMGYLSADRFWSSKHLLPSAAFAPPAHSIAVLPFVNLSGDQEQEYFSEGLSEELIDHLGHSADLKVIARTSSFQFKGRNEDVRSIARQLGVMYVLEGSVRKGGEQLRISAQLIRALDGVHLWSQSYDRNLVDIFAVQDEIAEKISEALRVALPNGSQAGSRPPDIRAYNLVLEGNYFKARRTPSDVKKATQLYQQATDIDPDYALAWARLASAYLVEELQTGSQSEDRNRLVLDALDRALRLDPKLVWAWYTRCGFELNVTWDWVAAKADAERMRQIDPHSDLLPSALADIALTFGDVDGAVKFYQESVERDPLNANMLDSLGDALCAASRLERCLQIRLRMLQLHPEFDGVNSSVGIARLYLGQFGAALTAMQQERSEDYRLLGLAMAYAALGRRTASDAALSSVTEKFASSDAYGIAAAHAYRGELDDAFRWLERAYRQRDAGMLNLKADPLLRNLHSDRRFQALLTRMGLTAFGQVSPSGNHK